MLFDEKDLDNSMDKIETMNFHQTVEVRAWLSQHVKGPVAIAH
jgi:Cft2 family RNA processing exonuclease